MRTKRNLILAMALAISLAALTFNLASSIETCLAVEASPDTDAGELYNATFAANIVAAFPDLELSVEEVESLRATGLGWGEIVIAMSLASSSGKEPSEVIAMADSGLGWGEIAKELGVAPNALGHAVSEVIGNSGREHVDQDVLDDAVISELLASNFGLENPEVAPLLESGLTKKDLLMALSAAAVKGDTAAFAEALTLRQESRNWQDVFQALGIDPRDARDMRTVMQRSEIKEQLRDMVNELKKGLEGSNDQTLDEDSNKDNDQRQESIDDKDDQNMNDEDDQNINDNDDQHMNDKDDQNMNDKDDQKLEKEHKSDKDNGGAGQGKIGENNGEKKEKRDSKRTQHKNEEGEN